MAQANPRSDDSRLTFELERLLTHSPTVNLHDLRVQVTDGRATIQGVAASLEEKQAAVDAAYTLDGIRVVDEAIAVEVPHTPRDADLSEDLDTALDREPEVDASRLGARSARSQAVLLGTAESLDELASAEQTVTEVPDTVNVIDSSRIENPYGPDVTGLPNAAADALSQDPVLRNRTIRPLLEETGKLVLVGEVRYVEEKERALRVVASVPGVHTVREELEVVP